MANLSEKYQKITQDNEHVSCVFLFSLEMCCSLQFFTTGLSLSPSLSAAHAVLQRQDARAQARALVVRSLFY